MRAYLQLMRLDKPIGILLLLWPTLTALVLAQAGVPSAHLLIVFILGTVLMRSAGCVVNDLADMHFDGYVERTQHRPLVTKTISKKAAIALTLVLCTAAFALVLTLNALTIQLSFLALFFAILYPRTKRFFSIPQAYLGIAFGFGILMAFAAVQGQVPVVAWLLFVANIAWAIAYDTEYAMVDREDDLKINIHSSAITFGRYDVLMVMVCYGITLSLHAVVGIQLQLGLLYYLGLVAATAIAIYHYQLIKTRDKQRCFKAFLHNSWVGFAIFAGVVTDLLK